jgi:hypothetical protein
MKTGRRRKGRLRLADKVVAIGLCGRHDAVMVLGHGEAGERTYGCTQSGAGVFAQPGPTIAEPHLDPGLGEGGVLSQFLACVHIRVLGPGKRFFKGVQLIARKGCSRSSLFALQQDAWLRFGITGI